MKLDTHIIYMHIICMLWVYLYVKHKIALCTKQYQSEGKCTTQVEWGGPMYKIIESSPWLGSLKDLP